MQGFVFPWWFLFFPLFFLVFSKHIVRWSHLPDVFLDICCFILDSSSGPCQPLTYFVLLSVQSLDFGSNFSWNFLVFMSMVFISSLAQGIMPAVYLMNCSALVLIVYLTFATFFVASSWFSFALSSPCRCSNHMLYKLQFLQIAQLW